MNQAIKSVYLVGLEPRTAICRASSVDGPEQTARERETRVRVASALAAVGISNAAVGIRFSASDEETGAPVQLEAAFDLAFAVALLKHAGCTAFPPNMPILGELALNGEIRPIRGALARARGGDCLVPAANAFELAWLQTVHQTAQHLRDFLDTTKVSNLAVIRPTTIGLPDKTEPNDSPINVPINVPNLTAAPEILQAIDQVLQANRDILFVGGRSSNLFNLCRYVVEKIRRLPIGQAELLTINAIHSSAGILHGELMTERPYRAPHHTVSLGGLVGGGDVPRVGEVSLAHGGVLILDSVDEFGVAKLKNLAATIRNCEAVFYRGEFKTPVRTPTDLTYRFPALPMSVVATMRGPKTKNQDKVAEAISDIFQMATFEVGAR